MVIKLESLLGSIGQYFEEVNPSGPHPTLASLIRKSGKQPDTINYILQREGLRDCDGNWSKAILDAGYITLSSYKRVCPESGLETRYKQEIVSPCAIEFFKTFIEEAVF